MPKKKTPRTFDEWLGKIVDDDTDSYGGRDEVAEWLGVSPQTANRRARGETPYLARELAIIAEKTGITMAEYVNRALRRSGGIEKLIAEYAPRSEPIPKLDDYRKPDLATVPEEELTRGKHAAGKDDELERPEDYS